MAEAPSVRFNWPAIGVCITLLVQLAVGLMWMSNKFAQADKEIAILSERQLTMIEKLDAVKQIVRINGMAIQQNTDTINKQHPE
jgi:hypothetical protein